MCKSDVESCKLKSAKLLMFYPCKLRGSKSIIELDCEWRKRRREQIRLIHEANLPLTELLDSSYVRTNMEFLLSSVIPNATRYTPYATHCIRNEFTNRHEERMSAKETSIVLAKFALSSKGIVKDSNRWINGTLLYNLNAENRIAAYVISVDLEDITVADVVRLKHAFYKRRLVTIKRSTLPDVGLCVACQYKDGKCKYGCLNRSNELSKKERITLPMFVLDYVSSKDVKLDIDFRARYSLLEVEEVEGNKPDLVDLYALITSDEGYEEVPKKVMENALQNMSTRNSFDYYCYGTNVLLVTNKEQYAESVLHKNLFHQGYEHPSNHIPEE
jgi:hypothetical protein